MSGSLNLVEKRLKLLKEQIHKLKEIELRKNSAGILKQKTELNYSSGKSRIISQLDSTQSSRKVLQGISKDQLKLKFSQTPKSISLKKEIPETAEQQKVRLVREAEKDRLKKVFSKG